MGATSSGRWEARRRTGALIALVVLAVSTGRADAALKKYDLRMELMANRSVCSVQSKPC